MVKKVEGALYKAKESAGVYPPGTILRLTKDDGTSAPYFDDGVEQWCLFHREDVKLLKPKKGDFVRLYRTKHSYRDINNLGYFPEQGMLKKGEHGIAREVWDDGTCRVEHNGKSHWYYTKDLAVIQRKGVNIDAS